LKSRPEREVFAARPVYKGRIYAADKDQRWAADIIDYTKNPATLDGRKYAYVLLVQDIFTRFAWAELMETRDQTPEAFQRLLERANRSPTVLTTDEDAVFRGARFEAVLRSNDIVHVLTRSREDLATSDRLNGQVRRALAVEVRAGAESWAALHSTRVSWTLKGGPPTRLGTGPCAGPGAGPAGSEGQLGRTYPPMPKLLGGAGSA